MAFTPAMIPYMVGGYAVDRMMGGSGMTGLALGTGVGGMGGFGGIAESLGMSGISALPSATASNSLGGGAALLGGGAGIPASTAVASSTPISLLGSATGNANNLYNVGMNGVTGSGSAVTGGIADLGTATIAEPNIMTGGHFYDPIRNNLGETIGPDMSFKQTFQSPTSVGTSASGKLGVADPTYQATQFKSPYTSGFGQNTEGIADLGLNELDTTVFKPDFKSIPVTEPRDIAKAGGYQEETILDKMAKYAEDNPLQVAALGLTAFGPKSSGKTQPVSTGSVGSIARATYNPPRSQIVKVQRA